MENNSLKLRRYTQLCSVLKILWIFFGYMAYNMNILVLQLLGQPFCMVFGYFAQKLVTTRHSADKYGVVFF